MFSSYPSRSTRHSEILAGISLLVLAMSASAFDARAAERAASPAPSHSTRDIGRPASTGLEPCQSGCSGTTTNSAPSTTGAATSAPANAPGGDGLSATGARSTPSAATPQGNTRGKAAERDAAKRWFRRSDGRVVPPAPLEEPRRGGVGTLIGITFA